MVHLGNKYVREMSKKIIERGILTRGKPRKNECKRKEEKWRKRLA